jgi:hypothetical protein
MGGRQDLAGILLEARQLLALPQNDFIWSSWSDSSSALAELDGVLSNLSEPETIDIRNLRALFLPTGDMQEVSIASGWGDEFLALAGRFDQAFRRFVASEIRSDPL